MKKSLTKCEFCGKEFVCDCYYLFLRMALGQLKFKSLCWMTFIIKQLMKRHLNFFILHAVQSRDTPKSELWDRIFLEKKQNFRFFVRNVIFSSTTQKWISLCIKWLKKNIILQKFGLRPMKTSAAVAVAEGKKPSASAVEIRPSVDRWV